MGSVRVRSLGITRRAARWRLGFQEFMGQPWTLREKYKSTEPALIPDSHIRAKSREWTSLREDPDFVRRPSMGLRWATLKLQ